jgi:hypothetical protein
VLLEVQLPKELGNCAQAPGLEELKLLPGMEGTEWICPKAKFEMRNAKRVTQWVRASGGNKIKTRGVHWRGEVRQ